MTMADANLFKPYRDAAMIKIARNKEEALPPVTMLTFGSVQWDLWTLFFKAEFGKEPWEFRQVRSRALESCAVPCPEPGEFREIFDNIDTIRPLQAAIDKHEASKKKRVR